MANEAIPRRKLYQEVLDRLLERIRTGEIPPGAHLPSERELMETYDVGRPAVREALQALERSGIVEIAQGERARVVVPTAEGLIEQITGGARHLLRTQPTTLEHLKDARLFLEVGTARLAATKASDVDIALLRTRLAEHRAALSNPDDFLAKDMEFHREIARISGNPILPAIVEAMFSWGSEFYRSSVRAQGVEDLTLAEHARVIDAIAARDPEAAERAVREHLTRANSLYRKLEIDASRQEEAVRAANAV